MPTDSHRRRLGGRWLIILLSLCLGWQLAGAIAAPVPGLATAAPILSQRSGQPPSQPVDYVPPSQQQGQQLYLRTCATCHIAIPPQVLPTETWRDLLQDSSHYGVTLQLPPEPARRIIWAYLSDFSRAKSPTEERVPYRLARSRYFSVLHPDVDLPAASITLDSCITCHRAAAEFNFRAGSSPHDT